MLSEGGKSTGKREFVLYIQQHWLPGRIANVAILTPEIYSGSKLSAINTPTFCPLLPKQIWLRVNVGWGNLTFAITADSCE